MWQLHARFRLGDYATNEIDLTPLLGCILLAGCIALIIQSGL